MTEKKYSCDFLKRKLHNREGRNKIIFVLPFIIMLLLSASLYTQSVTIANGATVVVASGAVAIGTGDITIDPGGAIDNSGTLQLEGNWTNNGLGLIGGSPGTVVFNGNNPLQTIGGSNSTAFNAITVDKGTSQSNICEVLDPGITLPATGNLVLNNGTFKISGTFSFSNKLFSTGAYTINPTCRLWLNNPNATITGQNGSITLNGGIKISAGTYNIGTTTDNSIDYNTGSTFEMGGGSCNVAGRIFTSTPGAALIFNQSNGNLTVVTVGSTSATYGGFDISSSSSFTTSGGNLVIQNSTSSTADYVNTASTTAVSGGTIIFGNASTPAATTFRSNASVTAWNVTLNNVNSPSLSLNQNLVVSNMLTMNGGNISTGAQTLILGTSTINPGSLSWSSGYIIGNFKRWVNTTGIGISFPVGTASFNRNATVTFTNLTSGSLTTSFLASDPGGAGLPLTEGIYTVDNQFTEGYWSLIAGDGLSSTNYDLELTGDGFVSYTENADTRIIKRTNALSNWTLDGAHQAAVSNIAKRTGLSGFSEFAHGSTSSCTPATNYAGPDQTICATDAAILAATIGGSATMATWSGGGGIFSPDATTLSASYTPSAGEILAGTVTLTLTTNDPDGPCTAAIDQVTITIDPAFTYYADSDGDGFGNGASSITICASMPAGYVTNTDDCDDLNFTYADTDGDGFGAGAATPCGVTNNLDCFPGTLTYVDADGDGFGSTTFSACSPITNNVDCNDAQTTYNDVDGDGFGAGSPSPCGVTNNLDCFPFDITYVDADGDGFGSTTMSACSPITNNVDCNDAQTTYNDVDGDGFGAGSPSACGVANNLDCFPFDVTYVDADGDGYGSTTMSACSPITNNADCDDTQFTYNDIDGDGFGAGSPSACGVANNLDCFPFDITYVDADGDGYGSTTFSACSTVTNNIDCNDGQITYADIDGDGFGSGGFTACGVTNNLDCYPFDLTYVDGDGDGYGSTTLTPCSTVIDHTDCDDATFTTHPGATELCNGIDDNCNGSVDDGLVFINYYTDFDNDGFGDVAASPVSSCVPLAGMAANNTDCDDGNAAIFPGATEICNAVDDDCDGLADDGLTFTTYFADVDGDTYGDAFNTTNTCDGLPAGYVTDNTDCDDALSSVNPGAVEICDGLDNDCDGEYDEGTATATISPPGASTVCKGDLFTYSANICEGCTYQWFKNGNIILGAVNPTYNAFKTGNYQVQVTIPEGCFALSSTASLTVNPKPIQTITAPNGLSLCTTVKLKVGYYPTGAWQWYKNGVSIGGATTYLYIATTPGNYSCRVTETTTGCFSFTPEVTVTACREVDNNFESTIELYPNPTDHAFTIDLTIGNLSSGEASIQIFNLVGELIYNSNGVIENNKLKQTIELSDDVPSGVYIVKVRIENQEFTQQLILQK